MGTFEGHAGQQTVAALQQFGVDTMFTLNGGHIWPFYEAARDQGMAIVDTRHESTATFAAEAYAKLTRRPGLVALTAGPGVTNAVSAVTSAQFNGAPVIVIGGRAPQGRWGSGSLQEFDHVPVLAPITKSAATVTDPARAGAMVHDSVVRALTPHRGPVFLDFPIDVFGPATAKWPGSVAVATTEADPTRLDGLAKAIGNAQRPAFLVGSDTYWANAAENLVAAAEAFDVPVYCNGLGRGLIPPTHRLAFMRTRSMLNEHADLVVVIGTPLDFRVGFGSFGDAQIIHVIDAESQRATHTDVYTVAGDIAHTLGVLASSRVGRRDHGEWVGQLTDAEASARADEARLLNDSSDPIKPARIYGELRRRLDPDAVVVCDGGDFVSYAGKYVEVQRPGGWLDTGPFGCLGNGLGGAIAARVVHPDRQVVLLLGDGAAGFSLMDVDTLVRYKLPVVMVVGNNGIWGLEKHPMRMIYGWDVACDLQPTTRYDEVVRALGGAGETVTEPNQIGPALDRAFASGVAYLVNVMTDPADMYPRTSSLA